MKKYFIYEIKKNAYALGALVLVLIILHVTPLLLYKPQELKYSMNLGMLSAYAGLLALAVPVQLLHYKMRRRSVDLYYSLPLSHTKILIVRYLVGLIAVFVPYTVAYWLGAFVVMAKIYSTIEAVWYLPLYFSVLIPVYIIYSLSAFVFTRANKEIDGVMFVLFWAFAVAAVVATATNLLHCFDGYETYFLPFKPLDTVTGYFQERIYKYTPYYSEKEYAYMGVGFAVNTLLSAAATFGLFFTEKRAKAENAGQISESMFGYRVMIPLYTVCLASVCEVDYPFTLFLLLLVATGTFFITVLYRRTIKIGKRQAIIFVISLLIGILLAVINTYT